MTHQNIPLSSKEQTETAQIAALIGKPWQAGAAGPDAFDCWGLVRYIQKTCFDRELPLMEDVDASRPREVIEAIRASSLHRRYLPIDPVTSSLRHGDLVLMARYDRPAHIGTWIDIGSEAGVLHSSEEIGVNIQTLAQIKAGWSHISFHRYAGGIDDIKSAVDFTPEQNLVTVVVINDALDPANNATVVRIQPGQSIAELVSQHSKRQPGDNWVCLDLVPQLRRHPGTGEDEWFRICEPGQIVWIMPPLPRGGDNGGSSQIMGALFLVAVAVAAPYALGALAPGLVGTLTGKLIVAGITIGANLLVSSFMPQPPAPFQIDAPSPTFSIGTPQNNLRPGGQMPVNYGSMHRNPDFIARPFANFVSGDQYLYMIFCIGLGEDVIHEIGVGDTPVITRDTFDNINAETIEIYGDRTAFRNGNRLSDNLHVSLQGWDGLFSNFEFEIIPQGKRVSLFPVSILSIDEVGGQELAPVAQEETATNGASVGPFIIGAADTEINQIESDFTFPAGLFDTNDSGTEAESVSWAVQYQKIDTAGNPVGSWILGDTYSQNKNTTTPIRITRAFSVPKARYQVRAYRIGKSNVGGAQGQDTLLWTGLRGRVPFNQKFDDITTLAIKIKADETTQNAAQQWYVKSKRVLPRWSQSQGQWVTEPNERIEAAVRDIITADYGLNLPVAMIDMPALTKLAGTWQARGDVCCTTIDTEIGAWEALELVLQSGRARPQFIGNTITFVRDQPRLFSRQPITAASIVRGSLSIERVHHRRDTPNVINMRYRDRDGQLKSVQCRPAGIANSDVRETTMDRATIVDRNHAWREGMYLAQSSNLRRRFVSFVTLTEGRSLIRGDQITVSHPRPKLGTSGHILAVDGDILTVDAETPNLSGKSIVLSRPDGSLWGPWDYSFLGGMRIKLLPFTSDFMNTMSATAPGYSYDPLDWIIPRNQPFDVNGNECAPTRFIFSTPQSRSIDCLIVEMVPNEDGTVQILAVEDHPDVHSADTGSPPAL